MQDKLLRFPVSTRSVRMLIAIVALCVCAPLLLINSLGLTAYHMLKFAVEAVHLGTRTTLLSVGQAFVSTWWFGSRLIKENWNETPHN